MSKEQRGISITQGPRCKGGVMRWTTDKPKVPGWYWWRRMVYGKRRKCVVEGKETLSGFFRYKDRIYSIYRFVSAIIDAREAGK